MAQTLALSIKIGADGAQAKKALDQLSASLKQLGASTRGTGARMGSDLEPARQNLNALGQAITSAKNQLLGFVAAYAGIRSLAGIAKIADEYNLLDARLRLVTGSAEEFAAAQASIAAMAQRLRVPLTDAAGAFVRLAASVKELGGTRQDAEALTEVLLTTARLSGASAGEAAASLQQFGQALGSGVLQGDELRSILENNQKLAQELAKALGVTVGELRRMGEEGKLTADKIGPALIGTLGRLREEAGALPGTFAGALAQVESAFGRMIQSADQASGFTRVLAGSLEVLARAFTLAGKSATDYGKAQDKATKDAAVSERVREFALALGGVADAGLTVYKVLKQVGLVIGAVMADMGNAMRLVADVARDPLGALKDPIGTIKRGFAGRLAVVEGFLDDSKKLWQDGIGGATAAIKQAFDEQAKAAKAGAGKAAQASAGFGAEAARKAAEEARRKLAPELFALQRQQLGAAAALAKDALDRERQQLEDAFRDNLVGVKSYYAERERITREAIAKDLEIKRNELAEAQKLVGLAKTDQERLQAQQRLPKILAEIEILQRRQGDVGVQSARDQARAWEDFGRELQAAKIQLAEILTGGNLSDQDIAAKVSERFRALREKAAANAAENPEGVRIVADLEAATIVQEKFNALLAQAQRIETERRNIEEGLRIRREAGLLTERQFQTELVGANEKAAAQLGEIQPKLQAVAGALGPDAAQRVAEFNNALARTKLTVDEVAVAIDGAIETGLTNALTDFASGTKTAGDAFRAFGLTVLQTLQKIGAEQIVQQILASLGGAGKSPGSFISAILRHQGGLVGGFGLRRMVPAFAFAAAPRYHSGGIAGLKPGEVPAVLQTGEEVLAKNDPRNSVNGGGQAPGVRIVNVLDPALAGDYLSSSAGERTILNVLRRNAGAVKQALA